MSLHDRLDHPEDVVNLGFFGEDDRSMASDRVGAQNTKEIWETRHGGTEIGRGAALAFPILFDRFPIATNDVDSVGHNLETCSKDDNIELVFFTSLVYDSVGCEAVDAIPVHRYIRSMESV